jgi:hypothetical protein
MSTHIDHDLHYKTDHWSVITIDLRPEEIVLYFDRFCVALFLSSTGAPIIQVKDTDRKDDTILFHLDDSEGTTP